MKNKMILGLALVLTLLGWPTLTYAEENNEVRSYKVQLHDALDRAAFLTAYQKACPTYPVEKTSEPRDSGDYQTTMSPVGEKEALVINSNGEGRIANIILLHQGKVTAEEQKAMYAIYSGILDALGYDQTANHEVKYEQSFSELDITTEEPLASRFTREDLGRIYTFYKSYNPQRDVTMILIEAVIDK
ncbi:MAG: hypothetical protein IJ849_00120 [Selenomonadaceae bacterium]|nr:hypothetical protein [Selenomonadaceae bacterium]